MHKPIKRNKMKKILIVIVGLILLVSTGFYVKSAFTPIAQGKFSKSKNKPNSENIFRDGDIIFQTSQSAQCKAVQIATKSDYSHCGIIYKHNNEYYVYEAVQPVTATPLNDWIKRGKKNHYVVKRLKNADQVLTPEVLQRMKQVGEGFYNKNYDLTFEWDDSKIYCSELVWKIYKRAANIEVGKLEKLGDFDLSHPIVQAKVRERYGNNIPLDEIVISPQSIFESDLLITVKEE